VGFTLHIGDAHDKLAEMPSQYVHCCVTSPPYWGLRDYGVDGQMGLEATVEDYVENMVKVFREVKRVLRDDGTLWLNLGDVYAGYWGKKYAHKPFGANRDPDETTPPNKRSPDFKKASFKPKDLIGIPWRVAFALQADGWYLRQDIIWHKPNPMPESVKDRCTKAHEYIFLMSKSARYYYDADAIKEAVKINGRNKRSVWTVTTARYKKAHFATFPPKLIEPCILAGCPKGGTVLDPFAGSGTTGVVALQHFRNFVGIEINEEYVMDLATPRLEDEDRKIKQDTAGLKQVPINIEDLI